MKKKAIIKQNMRRKIIVVFILLLLLTGSVLAGFWWIGKKAEAEKRTSEQAYYQSLLDQQRSLESLILARLATKGIDIYASTTNNKPPRYEVSNLSNLVKVSTSSLVRYADDIVKTLEPYSKERPNEVQVVLKALKDNDPEKLVPIENTIAMHQKTLQNLLAMPVPLDAQVVHTRLINSLAEVLPLLENMSQVFSKPEQAIESGQQYLQSANSFYWATENINVYFINHGIIFKPERGLSLYYNL